MACCRLLLLIGFFCVAGTASEIRIPLQGQINGQEVKFAFDTGADRIILFRSAADRLGLKLQAPPPDLKPEAGQVLFSLTEPVALTFGRHQLADLRLVVLDGPPGATPDEIDGVIGWTNIRSNVVFFEGDTLRLRVTGKAPAQSASGLRLGLRGDWNVLALQLPKPQAGQPVFLGIDTGSSHGVHLAPAAWRAFRATHAKAPTALETYFAPGTGFVITEQVWAGEIDLAGLQLAGVPVSPMNDAETRLFPPGTLAVLGMSALRRMDLVLNHRENVAFARPLRSPAPSFAHNRLGAAFLPSDPAHPDQLVAHVLPGSTAARCGIQPGDAVLKIDDLDVTAWRTVPGILPLSRFWEKPAGTSLLLTLKRGDQTIAIPVTLKDVFVSARR